MDRRDRPSRSPSDGTPNSSGSTRRSPQEERAYNELLRRCKLHPGEEKQLIKTISKLRKRVDDATELVKMFGDKCYAREKEKERFKLAKTFCEQAFGDLDIMYRRGPKAAWNSNLRRVAESQQPRNEFDFMFRTKKGSYQIGHLLGTGVSAEVYFGIEDTTNRKVAFKVFKKKYSVLARKEAAILKNIDHPNCIKLIEAIEKFQWPNSTGKSEVTSVLIFEYATKGELVTWLMNTGRFEAPLARWVFQKTLAGLSYCHETKNIAHLDIKADNILITSGPTVLLADFGFARKAAEKQMIEEICGTPQYYAPEMVRRKEHYRNVDVFALGVTYFMMRTANHPFTSASETDHFYRHVLANNWRKFWKAHKKSLAAQRVAWDISEQEMQLMERMLDPNMETRASLQEIRELPYLTDYSLNITDAQANEKLKSAKQLSDLKTTKDYGSGGREDRDGFDESEWIVRVEESNGNPLDKSAPLYHTDFPESGGTWFYSQNPPRWIIKSLAKIIKRNMHGTTDFKPKRSSSRASEKLKAEAALATASLTTAVHPPAAAPAMAASVGVPTELAGDEEKKEEGALTSAETPAAGEGDAMIGEMIPLREGIPPADQAHHLGRMAHGVFELNFKLKVSGVNVQGKIKVWTCPTSLEPTFVGQGPLGRNPISIVEFLFDSDREEFPGQTRKEFFTSIYKVIVQGQSKGMDAWQGAAVLMANAYNIHKDLVAARDRAKPVMMGLSVLEEEDSEGED